MKKTIVLCAVMLAAFTLAACTTQKSTTVGNDMAYKTTTVHDYKGERS